VRTEVFVSYSRKDKKAFDFLMANLAALENEGHRLWTDHEIAPGQQWHDEISRALARTRIAVLLVTPSFIASPYIKNHELPALLEAARSDGLQIFWIPWDAAVTPQLDRFQAAHPPSEPLATMARARRQQAMVAIVKKLAHALQHNPGAALTADSAKQSSNALLNIVGKETSDYERPSAVAIRPSLAIVYRKDGWHLENKGRGPALNIIVGQKHVKGASKGTWFNPVRVPTLGAGETYHLRWLTHENETGLGASYEDEDGRPYTTLTGNDLSRVLRERAMPSFPESQVRRDWEFFPK
jgi:hypothetical protein